METLTPEQARLVFIVYSSAIVPLLAIPYLHIRRLIPSWVLPAYIAVFIISALGWEIWFTYGIVGGDTVDMRRALGLSQRIPIHLNWVLNSLADAGAVFCGGLLLVWLLFGRAQNLFSHYRNSVLLCLTAFFIGQNILVEMFLYRDQLAIGKPLSWAILSPFGSWWNPILFEYQGRSVSLQGQLPWIILGPLFYILLVRFLGRRV